MLTLSGPGRVEVEIRRSRFVAHAARVDSVADTLAFHDSVADPTATHNCWAWKIGNAYRFNDDGEPGGTAGKPIFTAIDGRGLEHAMVVVTRYYGGIKLGAGGLVRAYSGAAARCIDEAGITAIQTQVEFEVAAGFDWIGEIYAVLESREAEKLEEIFHTDGVRIRASVAKGSFPGLRRALRNATRGEAKVTEAS